MANVFTSTYGWRYGGGNNKSILKLEGTLVVDTAEDIAASVFGLTKVIGTASVVLSTDAKVYTGTPNYAGTKVLITGGAANASQQLANGTYKVNIEGYA